MLVGAQFYAEVERGEIDPDGVERAMWIAAAAAVAFSCVGTALVFASREWLTARIRMPLLTALFAVLGLACVYVASALVFMRVTHLQIDTPQSVSDGSFSLSTVIVHPGLLFKLLPVISIVFTWLGLAARRRARVRKTAA